MSDPIRISSKKISFLSFRHFKSLFINVKSKIVSRTAFFPSTPARTHSIIKWTKISILETNIFYLKMMVILFEIQRAPSEIPANLPGQFSLSG